MERTFDPLIISRDDDYDDLSYKCDCYVNAIRDYVIRSIAIHKVNPVEVATYVFDEIENTCLRIQNNVNLDETERALLISSLNRFTRTLVRNLGLKLTCSWD